VVAVEVSEEAEVAVADAAETGEEEDAEDGVVEAVAVAARLLPTRARYRNSPAPKSHLAMTPTREDR
jgi:hypothetical protein